MNLKAIIYTAVILIGAVIFIWPSLLQGSLFKNDDVKYAKFEAVFLNIYATVVFIVLLELTTNLKRILLWIQLFTIYFNSDIRLSAAYLFKIEYNGKYLLVLNGRFAKYQPVGGVYKRHPSSEGAFNQLGIQFMNDTGIQIDDKNRMDLRGRVKGRQVLKFLAWFDSKRNRETDQYREFYEELIATSILPVDQFRIINTEFLGAIPRRIAKNTWGKQEIKIHEIYKLNPTADQETALKQLFDCSNSGEYIWVTESEILEKRHFSKAGSSSELTLADNVESLLIS